MKSRDRRLGNIAVMGAIIMLVFATGVHAATFTVTNTNDSGAGSLRAAVASASSGDTINFSPSLPTPATITLTSFPIGISSKSITITGPGAANLALNGNNARTVLEVIGVNPPGATVTISGLTITNGNAGSGAGGGIYNNAASLTLNNCRVVGNTAHRGGGIVNVAFPNVNATLQINDSEVSDNISSENGGGIFNWGDTSGFPGTATLQINRSVVSGNRTINPTNAFYSGAGIYNFSADSATVEINDSTISGNFTSSQGTGGGIVNDSGSLTLNNTTLSGNGAGGGGAMRISSQYRTGAVAIINSTLSGNSANFGGGAVYNSGNLVIRYSTLSGNSTTSGPGGILNLGGTVNLGSTILDQSGASGANLANSSGAVISGGYNLSSDGGGGFLTAPGDQINKDPLLGPLQDNGGPTSTHALSADSPAIDAGDPSFTPPPSFDQRGSGFARVIGGRIDVGAFEVEGGTPTGTSVVVQPTDSTTGTTPVTLTFSSVSQGGTTALTTSNSGPANPSGFSIGSPPTYYELSTTALFSGPISICIDYSGVTFTNPPQLELLHFLNGAWVDTTTSLDTVNKVICGSVNSLSPFAIFNRTCGNGIVDPGEQCDDGSANGTLPDCCSATCAFKPSGTTCDDGSACTQTDQCSASGVCAGSNPVACQAEDVCHIPGSCDPATGVCSNPPFDPIASLLGDPANLSTDIQAVQCLIFELSNGEVPAVP